MKISIRVLYLLSALYIIFPLVIFAFGWLTAPLAICMTVGFIPLLYALFKKRLADSHIVISIKEGILIGALLIIWTIISGTGHRGFMDGDGYKHNAILNDLISLDWPVAYQQFKSKELVYLCYYIAYYLPAALVGKFFGWKIANIVLFGWTFAGVSLSILWLLSLYKKGNKTLYTLFFIFFGGLDALGRLIMRNKVVNGSDWEWWARNWEYSGNTTLLFYVPQHALIGWILVGVVAYGLLKKRQFPFLLALLACVPLWSPFVFLGLLPFFLLYVIQNKKVLHWGDITVAFIIIAFQLVYFSANLTFIAKDTNASAWLWQIEKLTHSWVLLRLFLFYVFEFGIFALLIYFFKTPLVERNRRFLYGISVGLLILLPWYKMGLLNDFVMRVSIPALWVICYFWIETLINTQYSQKIKVLLFIIITIAALYPSILFFNGVKNFSWGPPKASLTTYEDPTFRKQYLGSPKSIFFSYFIPQNVKQKIGIMKYK